MGLVTEAAYLAALLPFGLPLCLQNLVRFKDLQQLLTAARSTDCCVQLRLHSLVTCFKIITMCYMVTHAV
jgi:hypothetical protein